MCMIIIIIIRVLEWRMYEIHMVGNDLTPFICMSLLQNFTVSCVRGKVTPHVTGKIWQLLKMSSLGYNGGLQRGHPSNHLPLPSVKRNANTPHNST